MESKWCPEGPGRVKNELREGSEAVLGARRRQSGGQERSRSLLGAARGVKKIVGRAPGPSRGEKSIGFRVRGGPRDPPIKKVYRMSKCSPNHLFYNVSAISHF